MHPNDTPSQHTLSTHTLNTYSQYIITHPTTPQETDEERAIREAQERKKSDDEEIEDRKRKVAERRKREAEQREKDAELLRASQESARTLLKASAAQVTPSSSESQRLEGTGSGSADGDSPTSSGEKGMFLGHCCMIFSCHSTIPSPLQT